MSDPKKYRKTIGMAHAATEHLPRFLLNSRMNAWGRQREVPVTPDQTFHAWYLKNREAKK